MNNKDIVQAWKDERFRSQLSAQQRNEMLADPSGEIELDDDNLGFAGATEITAANLALTIENCQHLTLPADTNTLRASEQVVPQHPPTL